MGIKSAEDILNKHIHIGLQPDNIYSYESIHEAMKDYAEQFIDLAAKEAKIKEIKSIHQGMNNFVTKVYIDEDSILGIKQLIR